MNNKREPLLSDKQIADRVDEYILGYRTEITRVAKEFRDIYEAARTKDAELIQSLVDALQTANSGWRSSQDNDRMHAAIAAAEDAGFKPSNQ